MFGQGILTLGYLDKMHSNAPDELCDSIIVASCDASLFEQVLAESRVTDSESELLLLRRLGGWQILCEELLEHG